MTNIRCPHCSRLFPERQALTEDSPDPQKHYDAIHNAQEQRWKGVTARAIAREEAKKMEQEVARDKTTVTSELYREKLDELKASVRDKTSPPVKE